MEKIDGDIVDLEKLRFEFLRPLPVEKTKKIVLIYPLSGASPLGSNPRTPYKAVLVLPSFMLSVLISFNR